MSISASSTCTLVAPSTTNPHEPPGLTRFFESPFNGPLGTISSPVVEIIGHEWESASGIVQFVANNTGPKSPGSVLQYTYPIGLTGGSSVGIMQAWDTGSESNDTQYKEIYETHWTLIPESGFQFPGSAGWKPFGYLGYGGAGFENPVQMIYGTQDGSGATLSSFIIQLVQQNSLTTAIAKSLGGDGVILTQNLGATRLYTCGRWNRWELHAKLNSAPNVPDGLLEVWFDNGDGQGLLAFMRYTKMIFMIDSAHSRNGLNYLSGFYGRRWDPVWGGGSGTRTIVNHLLVDHFYISGVLK